MMLLSIRSPAPARRATAAEALTDLDMSGMYWKLINWGPLGRRSSGRTPLPSKVTATVATQVHLPDSGQAAAGFCDVARSAKEADARQSP